MHYSLLYIQFQMRNGPMRKLSLQRESTFLRALKLWGPNLPTLNTLISVIFLNSAPSCVDLQFQSYWGIVKINLLACWDTWSCVCVCLFFPIYHSNRDLIQLSMKSWDQNPVFVLTCNFKVIEILSKSLCWHVKTHGVVCVCVCSFLSTTVIMI